MENASKALIMASIIIIGVLLLALMVYFFSTAYGLRSSFSDNVNTTRIVEFNTRFTKYNITMADYKKSKGRDYVTIHEILSLANYAREFNEGLDENSSEYISIFIEKENVSAPKKDQNDLKTYNNQKLEDNMLKKFVASSKETIKYSDVTGRITAITFEEIPYYNLIDIEEK